MTRANLNCTGASADGNSLELELKLKLILLTDRRREKMPEGAARTKADQKNMPGRTSLEVVRVCGPLFKISRVKRFAIKWPGKKPRRVQKGVWLLENGKMLAERDVRGSARGSKDVPIYVGAECSYMWMSALRAYIRKNGKKRKAK